MYFGIDFGTQSVKGVVTDENLTEKFHVKVNFDTELPEFGTIGGVKRNEKDDAVVWASPIMWLKAFDLLMQKLSEKGTPFHLIKGVSGDAQQHGSVFWKYGSGEKLKNLIPEMGLHEQLKDSFTLERSPVWMDSSTTEYCDLLERKIGGAQELAKLTGSRAYERFTGPQIAKVFHKSPEVFAATERISLVSSFLCSLLLGDYASIDWSDGSGMNLMNIKTKKWSLECANFLTQENGGGEELISKLGSLVSPNVLQGKISSYFVQRFGFSPECDVLTFTGDNPSSFAEMGLTGGDIGLSLGTSDTLFLSLPNTSADGFTESHIFVNPVNCDGFMALLCFKNGSLTRERFKKAIAENSWNKFNKFLQEGTPGNNAHIGLFYDLPEILPKIHTGDYRQDFKGNNVEHPFESGQLEIRALVEGQFISKRIYAERIGLEIQNVKRILATGGGSANVSLLQVMSDVFQAPVFVQMTSNSADFGGCARLRKVLKGLPATQNWKLVCNPNKTTGIIYDELVRRYSKFIETLLHE